MTRLIKSNSKSWVSCLVRLELFSASDISLVVYQKIGKIALHPAGFFIKRLDKPVLLVYNQYILKNQKYKNVLWGDESGAKRYK